MKIEHIALAAGLALTLAVAACGSEQPGSDRPSAMPPATPSTTGTGDLTPDAGGKVILVEMETDAAGANKFEPAEFQAKRGDVIRFTLISGVHNANFLSDSNPGKAGLPAAGPMLQLPMQKYDVKVTWGPGRYYFQCDPHALLGMVGHVNVN